MTIWKVVIFVGVTKHLLAFIYSSNRRLPVLFRWIITMLLSVVENSSKAIMPALLVFKF